MELSGPILNGQYALEGAWEPILIVVFGGCRMPRNFRGLAIPRVNPCKSYLRLQSPMINPLAKSSQVAPRPLVEGQTSSVNSTPISQEAEISYTLHTQGPHHPDTKPKTLYTQRLETLDPKPQTPVTTHLRTSPLGSCQGMYMKLPKH